MADSIADLLLDYAPYPRRQSATGYVNFNCPCCVAAGEPTPDTKTRGGFRPNLDGSVFYHCHRCGTNAGWRPGEPLSRKLTFVMRCFGIGEDAIRRLNFDLYRQRQDSLEKPAERVATPGFTPNFPEVSLPKEARPLLDWLRDGNPPADAIAVAEYLEQRGDAVLTWGHYHWSPEERMALNRRVIIPFTFEGRTVGFTTRLIDKETPRNPKYWSGAKPNHFLFNNRVLGLANRKFVILVEGPLDAIAIDGVAVLGKSITLEQAQWLKQSGKTVIVLPDGSADQTGLMDYAERYVKSGGWLVSFPWTFRPDRGDGLWGRGVKDAADAVRKYGRLYAVRAIIDRAVDDPVKIKMFKQKLLHSI